jgi:hypothetical protein
MSGLIGQANMPTGSSLLGETDAAAQQERWAKERAEMEMGQHLNTLLQAQRIRSDPALMAQLREWVRAKKDELTTVLDDIG